MIKKEITKVIVIIVLYGLAAHLTIHIERCK